MPTTATPTITPSRRRLGALLLGAAFLTLGAGCYYPGGAMASKDQFTYASTTWQPMTISLVDTRIGETIWSVDVPVGKNLALNFQPAPQDEVGADPARPDLMNWAIMSPDQHSPNFENKVRVPDKSARRVEVSIRPTPELPPEMAAAREGRQAPLEPAGGDLPPPQ